MCRYCEHQLSGRGPWRLPDGSTDIDIIHTPGHTRGSIVLHYKPAKVLFTGDHLAFDDDNELTIMRQYNAFSVREQLTSVAKLEGLDALLLLPGHDRRGKFADGADRAAQLKAVLKKEL